ncbi:MAG: hypothetical protein WBA16_11710 [Nonlabens sp.]
MKLPVIKHLQRGATPEQLETTLEVLEHFIDHRSVSEQDNDVIGELITNICGAIEVHANIANGMSGTEAANSFAQKVMGSIDR